MVRLSSILLPLLLALGAAPARADDDGIEQAYKLTVGRYHGTLSGNALDLNLRRTLGTGNVWLGVYNAPAQRDRQWRLGADGNVTLGAFRLQPSAQIASHRHASGSIGFEAGETWYAGAGLGRTNLRPNTNLNFDPGDAYSLTAGLRSRDGHSYQLLWIRDNRQNPDQRHLHLVWRLRLPERQRLTLDLLHKQGLVDDQTIGRWGVMAAYDWPSVFVRVAYDPKVNFTPDTQWRFSAGTRF